MGSQSAQARVFTPREFKHTSSPAARAGTRLSEADCATHDQPGIATPLLQAGLPVVERHYPAFAAELSAHGRALPAYVQREFEDYLKCGRLEHGFLKVRCTACHAERLVAFSCKRRGFCPSCGARRMTETAALLVDAVLPRVPLRQWVLSVPFPLQFRRRGEPRRQDCRAHSPLFIRSDRRVVRGIPHACARI